MLEYVTTHADAVLDNWLLEGASRANTDNGRLYVQIIEAGGDALIDLYRDAACLLPVASGTLPITSRSAKYEGCAADSGKVILTEVANSGLSGIVRAYEPRDAKFDVDVFYADDDDLVDLQKDVRKYLIAGKFADRQGFADPLARAKRVMDALMHARLSTGWHASSLKPLAAATARFALFFLYDHLSTRSSDEMAALRDSWRRAAREKLPEIGLMINDELVKPFEIRKVRP